MIVALVFLFSTAQTSSILGPPKLLLQSPDVVWYQLDVSENEQLRPTLKCQATENADSYVWFHNDAPLIIGNDIDWIRPGQSGSIIFKKPLPEHQGYYQCFVSNIFGTAVTNRVHMQLGVLEHFVSHPIRKIQVTEGDSLSLDCQPPKGTPAPTIFWIYRDTEQDSVIETIRRRHITVDENGKLQFSNVEKHDGRANLLYECAATSAVLHGEYRSGDQIQLEVQSRIIKKPIEIHKLYLSPPEVTVKAGERLKIQCIFGGKPVPTVFWSKLDGELPKARMKSLTSSESDFGKSLVIDSIVPEDAGKYECKAQHLTHTINVRVSAAPYWDLDPPRDVTSSEDSTTELECLASGQPTPIIRWSMNGIPMHELSPDPRRILLDGGRLLRLKSLQHELDTGVYQCNASNPLGYVFANAFVHVKGNQNDSESMETDEDLLNVPGEDDTPAKDLAEFEARELGTEPAHGELPATGASATLPIGTLCLAVNGNQYGDGSTTSVTPSAPSYTTEALALNLLPCKFCELMEQDHDFTACMLQVSTSNGQDDRMDRIREVLYFRKMASFFDPLFSYKNKRHMHLHVLARTAKVSAIYPLPLTRNSCVERLGTTGVTHGPSADLAIRTGGQIEGAVKVELSIPLFIQNAGPNDKQTIIRKFDKADWEKYQQWITRYFDNTKRKWMDHQPETAYVEPSRELMFPNMEIWKDFPETDPEFRVFMKDTATAMDTGTNTAANITATHSSKTKAITAPKAVDTATAISSEADVTIGESVTNFVADTIETNSAPSTSTVSQIPLPSTGPYFYREALTKEERYSKIFRCQICNCINHDSENCPLSIWDRRTLLRLINHCYVCLRDMGEGEKAAREHVCNDPTGVCFYCKLYGHNQVICGSANHLKHLLRPSIYFGIEQKCEVDSYSVQKNGLTAQTVQRLRGMYRTGDIDFHSKFIRAIGTFDGQREECYRSSAAVVTEYDLETVDGDQLGASYAFSVYGERLQYLLALKKLNVDYWTERTPVAPIGDWEEDPAFESLI